MLTNEWKRIQQGEISPVYVLIGTEQYLIDETLKRIEEALGIRDGEEKSIFNLEETPVQSLIDESNIFPFFAEKKLVIGKNAQFLKATDKTREKVAHDMSALEEWIDHPSDTSVTIFVAPYEKLDDRKKITKKLKQVATVIEAKQLQQHDLLVWLRNEFSKFGKNIHDETLQMMIHTTGTNLLQLSSETEKIVTYLGEKNELSPADVENLLSRTLEQDVFQLLDAYFSGDKTKAIQIYHDLIRQKEEPIMINALLASQVRLQLNVLHLQSKGYPVTQIAKQLKVNPYRVRLVAENKRPLPEKKLLEVLHRIADNDMQLKTTSLRRDRVLELFLLRK